MLDLQNPLSIADSGLAPQELESRNVHRVREQICLLLGSVFWLQLDGPGSNMVLDKMALDVYVFDLL